MRIAIITHPLDVRLPSAIRRVFRKHKPTYMIEGMVTHLRKLGHTVFYISPGDRFRRADAALVHVDQTRLGPEFGSLIARYPVVINGKVLDISKSFISRNLLTRDSDWSGPVMVKSELNARGAPEHHHARKLAPKHAKPWLIAPDYQIFADKSQVSDGIWTNRNLIVEKYLPEKQGDLFVLRIWTFMGSFERCNAYTTPEAIAKGKNVVGSFPCAVPDEIRAERLRIGSDYGKYDFAITPDGPVLYDANKTPGYLHSRPDIMRQSGIDMATAMLDLIRLRQASMPA